ncbi:unnamed protein product [Mytilus edulis]|uniref:Short-chain collagen C4 n=1 Tax=Mytilus edulis TaxID=6550 RepID=A0A8S3SRJ6_MYTED|nr:unnamed protein product [Mytilus edulis]
MVILATCGEEKSKRLLLNDPDVLGNRLLHIESALQDLQVKYSSLQKELADEKSKHEQSLQSYAAGEKYYYSSSYRGGASNMLCLPDNPELSNKTAVGRSLIYGTEFNTNDLIAGANDEDVSCAMCRSTNTSSTVMFPGRKTCYPGWKEEYNGVLAASAHSHNPSPYICVDAHPAYVYGGGRNNEEHILYISVLKCGSIQCPPYTDNVQMCIILILSMVILATCGEEKSKRLLLNDPDVLGNRLLHIESMLQDLQKELADEKSKHEQSLQNQGSTYIRWGRNDCVAQNTELIYKGYAAGEKYVYSSSYRGGASNMLCLPDDPELSNRTASTNSQIYGTEFEDNDLVTGALNEDVSCALCRSTNTSSTVMFPGRKTCYSGWKEEYNGVLASSAYSHNPSPYICVDAHPSYVNGGQRNNDEHRLYVSNLKCGSIPCPPYTDNVQVNCVVCSK